MFYYFFLLLNKIRPFIINVVFSNTKMGFCSIKHPEGYLCLQNKVLETDKNYFWLNFI